MVYSLYTINKYNIGDLSCPPKLYFDIPGKVRFLLHSPKVKPTTLTIWGGGAISHHADKYGGNKILWGAGATVRHKHGKKWLKHEHISDYLLYGCRDYGHGIWVPCASCMSALFDNPPAPTQKSVYYGHEKYSPIKNGLNNDVKTLEEAINYLASAETIYTSSYHGMYWGILLGRNVVVKPFGSKFYGLPYDVEIVKEFADQKGRSFPNALKECRQANIDFYEKVKPFLQKYA